MRPPHALQPLLLPMVLVLSLASGACTSDCDEVWENCTWCGRALGYPESELSFRCPHLEDEDTCEQVLELTGGCPYLDENKDEVCGNCRGD